MISKKAILSCISAIVFLAGSIFFFSNTPALAVDLPRLSQLKIRLSVSPGQAGYGEITVDNPSQEPMSVRLYLEDWYYAPGGDGTKTFAPAGTTSRSCAPWLSFSPPEIELPPYGQRKVNYTVKVPPEAKGGYYGTLFFEMGGGKVRPENSIQEVDISLVFRIAALFYVEAKGTVERTGAFENLLFEKDSDSGKTAIKMDFRNTGNVDITASGLFNIMDEKGMVYSRGEFGDAYTFAGETAKLIATLKEPLPIGRYDLILTLDTSKALKEANMGRIPSISREVEIEVNENGDIMTKGGFK